ncbi:vWFA domain containing protein [uncultured Caudovirales phage]|uniref:VWFA domain containing protein n=1 Tax=uncultured Caudovirales phage TaxID=2100421 RepID=A0A6J7WY33_9CAUD|nr:vWFA domain containing protein [uncultured Caudovirales phage]
MASLQDRIDLAFSKLGLREAFIAAVMTRVKREVSDKIPTAATNGTWVKFNPTWCEPLTDEELFGLVLHESCHVVLMHMWRREGRDMKLWNVANDAIINSYIKSRGWQLPKGGVDLKWVKEEHSSEYVYNKLKEQQQQQSKSGGSGDGKGAEDNMGAGGFDGQGDLEDAQDEATRVDMEASIVAAAKMAKDCGQGSALIDRVLEKVGNAKVRWQDVTRSMMTESCAADYTYMRPSRRFIGSGLYMPSLRSDALGGLAIGFDTSGSMGPDECNQIAAELQAIVDDLQPSFVEVVYCDYAVTHTERFERDELLALRPRGGGGTRFQPVFKHFAETGERYCGMIYFTDMEGNLDECEEPEMPVIWADIGYSHPREPFGTRVEVPL